jgi:type IV pilus assembly protein PilB
MTSEARLGQVLVREGLITDAQLRAALARQNPGTYVPLGQVLLGQQLITRRQLNLALEAANKRPKLGEVLVRNGSLTADQLQHALTQQIKLKLPIGQLLVRLNYLTDETMRQALGAQLNVPFVDLDRTTIEPTLKRIINRSYARRGSLVPVASVGQSLTVCMDDPTNQAIIEELHRSTGYVVTVVTASHDAIERAFARLYGSPADTVPPVEGSLDLITEDEAVGGKSRYIDDFRQNKKADTLVKQLLSTALERRASDIHIETLSSHLQVRFRIDGVLEEAQLGELQTVCNQSAREIVSRLKILGKLDIAERRRPQDGSFRVRVDRRGEQAGVDLRVSVVPGYYGESVVLRILDQKGIPGSIDQLGLSPAATEKLRQLLRRPSGIILATGPTGSGKSTTLFASLMTLYRPEIRILTAEDPVEYVFEQFSQSEVNEQIGNTFAAYLRAFLRHDPEVIMVGEIRDEETAEMVFRAAQTGHLLLSTLHTNTAVAAVTRLLDLKIDPNMLSSSLIGVIGQRLVREVCTSCKVSYQPSDELLHEFFDAPPEGLRFYKGRGCDDCHLTGFHGRMIVSELWVPDEEDLILINKGAHFDEVRESAKRSTLSMADDALERLVAGRTNLEELIRMLPYTTVYEFRQRRLGHSGASAASPAA